MIIVALRTDNPQAEIYLYEDQSARVKVQWHAHRQLSATIHQKIQELLEKKSKSIRDIGGVIFYQGPGSFTGLRIGVSVANALGSGLGIPVVAVQGEDWLMDGLNQLKGKTGFIPIEPHYGADAFTTLPKK